MKKLMVSAFALAMMTTGAMAGEQLTTSQLDQVTAGFFDTQRNRNRHDADRGRALVGRGWMCLLQQERQRFFDGHRLQQQCDRTGERRLARSAVSRTA